MIFFKKLILIFSLFFVSFYVQADRQIDRFQAFREALKEKDFKVVQEILRRNPNFVNTQENSEMDRDLARMGIFIYAPLSRKKTPLHIVVSLYDIIELSIDERIKFIKLLLENGADPNINNINSKQRFTLLDRVIDSDDIKLDDKISLAEFIIEHDSNL